MPGYIDGRYIEDIEALLRPGQREKQAAAVDRFDTFVRGNDRLSRLRRLPTGQEWQIALVNVPDDGFVIRDGGLQITKHNGSGNAAAYAWCFGPPLDELAADFFFTEGSTNGSAVALIASKRTDAGGGSNIVAVNSVHAVISPVNMAIGIFDGVSLSNFYSVPFANTLPTGPDNVHTCRIRRVGANTLQIYRPDGAVDTVTDPRIDTWWGGTALIEPFHSGNGLTTDKRPVIKGFYAKNQTKIDLLPVGARRKPGWWLAGGVVPSNANSLLDVLYLTPVFLSENMAFDLASLNVTTAATAGGVARLCVYADDGTFYPGKLLWTGDVATTAVAAPEVAAVFSAGSGVIWVGSLAQVAQSGVTFGFGVADPVPSPAKPAGGYHGALFIAGQSGGPPANFPAGASGTNGAPRVGLRIA